MDVLTERLPWDGLAVRRLRLEGGRLVIQYKNIARSFDDEYEFRKIDPVFRVVRRGEPGWSGTVFGLIVVSIVFFILTKMSSSLVFNGIVMVLQICTLFATVFLIAKIFLKREHLYVLDRSGECIVSLKSTPRSRAFTAKLKAAVERAPSGQ